MEGVAWLEEEEGVLWSRPDALAGLVLSCPGVMDLSLLWVVA